MKKVNRDFSILFCFTLVSLTVFVIGEIVSVSMILYSVQKDMINLFQFGSGLLGLWATNPIPLIASIIGVDRGLRYRKHYLAIICLSPVIWLIGLLMITPYF